MKKIKTVVLCVTTFLLLIFLNSCNLPVFTPGGTTDTPTEEETTVDVEPTAPANTDGAETVRIPGGTFLMGSADTDIAAAADERPVHSVTVGTFYLYTHEVTNEMYQACVDAGACTPINVMNSGPTTHFADTAYANYPVTGVDWNMAHDYCNWAGARLPTEAEWEYAARGTDSLLHPWGADEATCDRTNMLGCLVPPDVVEVGSYLLGNSPFEVWDMAGNVWEWVQDWYAEGYYSLSPATNPIGPYSYTDPNNPIKVVRGGGLYSTPEQMRSADRASAIPYRAFDDVGFRCVAEGESLPDEYTETRDRHEMVPPDPLDGGGDPLDDPEEEPYASMGYSNATCPDADGNITIYAEAETNEPGAWSVTVEDIPFACTYDDAAHLLTCTGPQPAATEFPGEYHVEIYFPGGGLIGHQYPEIPTDCDSMSHDPWSVTFDADCPEDGWVTFYITTDIPMVIDRVQDFWGTELACWPLSDYLTACIIPEDPLNPTFPVTYHGMSLDGHTGYMGAGEVSIPDSCPAEPPSADVAPFCFEGQPTVHVSFDPAGTMASVLTTGIPLTCIGMTPTDLYCGPLPGTSGSTIPITTCFTGGPCEDWTITVPDCGPGTAHWFDTSVTTACYEGLGPVAVIHYTPADQLLVAANVNGADLTCYASPEAGWYMCSGLPGVPGDPGTLSFCLADGTCFSESISTPDCGVAEWGEDWRLIAVACTDNVTEISFMIDTYLDWLVPGAVYTYSARDGVVDYACSLHPTVAGRVYCEGPRPESPGNLEFCMRGETEAASTCFTFTEYAGWVAETSCEAPITEEPVVDPCSVYATYGVCVAHKDQCRWVTDHCESNP